MAMAEGPNGQFLGPIEIRPSGPIILVRYVS